jgi:hypothetical protein
MASGSRRSDRHRQHWRRAKASYWHGVRPQYSEAGGLDQPATASRICWRIEAMSDATKALGYCQAKIRLPDALSKAIWRSGKGS